MIPLVTAIDAALGYGRRTVLAGISFEIRAGQFWFLLGPNGAGKTTILRAVLRQLVPRSGRLLLHPEITSWDRIGFVPQRCDLNATLPTTVREFVSLGTVGLSVPGGEAATRLSWALEKVGLEGLEKQSYWSLSGGQRQRALVARALVRRPGFLVADEPTAGLDLPATEVLLESLVELNRKEGLTVLLATHELTLAARHATHIILCGTGGVLAGAAAEILTEKNLSLAYGFPVRVRKDDTGGFEARLEPQSGGLTK